MLTVIMPTSLADTNTTFAPVSAAPAAIISVPTLRDAVIESNYLFATVNPGVANTIRLQAATYTLSIPNSATTGYETASATGDLNINGNLTVQGVGVPGVPLTTIKQQAMDRVFAVNTPSLTVNFNNLAITCGTAVDDAVAGTLPGTTTAQGGGIWAQGDTLALLTVTFRGDRALGGAGTATAFDGQTAQGGAVWDAGGTLAITNATFQTNSAIGGAGFAGTGASPFGGIGGGAYGGGLYATAGVAVTFGGASLSSTVNFQGNQADGGAGGAGASTSSALVLATGGIGGNGGAANGGALYADAGSTVGQAVASSPCSVLLNVANFTGNKVVGGNAGKGGNGTMSGGFGGFGGTGFGAGLYTVAASITLRGGSISSNLAQGGAGGNGGSGAEFWRIWRQRRFGRRGRPVC